MSTTHLVFHIKQWLLIKRDICWNMQDNGGNIKTQEPQEIKKQPFYNQK